VKISTQFKWFLLIQTLVFGFVVVDLPGQTGQRFMADMPDDFEGNQIHVVYVTPKDGRDRGADFNGQLRNEVIVAQQWLFKEVGRSFKFDTYQGEPDITFVRLSRTEHEIFNLGDGQSNVTLQLELDLLGFNDPQKLYAVYFDGGFRNGECGGNGGVGGIALTIMGGRMDCFLNFSPQANGSGQMRQGSHASVMMHEVIHALDFVARCAPDHDDPHPGHLQTISDDLMAFDGSGFTFYRLDKNRSEYYGHNIANCVDLEDSALWQDAPTDADPIPGKSERIELPMIDCSRERNHPSMGGGESSPIEFVNLSQRTVQFYWIGFDGNRNVSEKVPFFSASGGGSVGNHSFVATYEDTGECIGVFVLENGNNKILIIDETTPEEIVARINGEVSDEGGVSSEPPPPDEDGDGVPDDDGLCPTFPGSPATDGC
jgi:hypothetical protein